MVCIINLAQTIGDPHIYTLDQHKYTFNRKGEFILIETTDKSFTLQGRMVETQNGTASVFSAVVSKTNDSSTAQFEIQTEGNVTSLVCLVNREKIDFNELKSQEFDGVTVYESSNNSFAATFSNGAYLQVQEQNGFISLLTVGLPTIFHNKTNGLMGVFNGDSSDDMTPRGSDDPLPLNSTLQTIHEKFGITCEAQYYNELMLIIIIHWSRRIYAWARTKHFGCHSVILSVCYPGMPL